MKIDWSVRFKNPTFIVSVLMAIFMPILAYFGMNWSEMTTWGAIWDLMVESVKNPVVVVAVIVSVYNAIIDPTTKGISDNEKILKNDETKGE